MSIMREKPYYCDENFYPILPPTVATICQFIPSINIHHDEYLRGTENRRWYPLKIWETLNPFYHPRYKIFLWDNPILQEVLYERV